MAIDHEHIKDHVRNNVELIVAQLNRELELAELVRLNIALHVDHTIGRPIKVTVVRLKVSEDSPCRTAYTK